jgi:hypothetical protein
MADIRVSQGKLRRVSIVGLVLTFSQPTLVLTACNEASFCTPVTPHRVRISSLGCIERIGRNLPEWAASTSCRCELRKEQLSSHRWMGRDRHSSTRPQVPFLSHRLTFFRFLR